MDREAIYTELRDTRVTFRRLVEDASPSDLARRSDGTRWTNRQLLFHMLFGYLLMRALLPLTAAFARLPAGAGRVFAAGLDAMTAPFHWVNYLGSCAGGVVFPRRRLARSMDRVTEALERRLRAETDDRLRTGMSYPPRWDPFFKDFMTVADLYHYPTQHFGFHARQLTLPQPPTGGEPR